MGAVIVAYTEYRVTKHGENAKVLRKRAGAYLRGLREDAKLTQADIAKRLGLDYYTFISQIETGLTRLPPEHYPAYAKAVGKEVDELAKELLRFYDPLTYASLFPSRGK
jgi:transcriptional regulator with XRE-family HTH domain